MPPTPDGVTVADLLAIGRQRQRYNLLRASLSADNDTKAIFEVVEQVVRRVVPRCLWDSIRWDSLTAEYASLTIAHNGYAEVFFGFVYLVDSWEQDLISGKRYGKAGRWGVRGMDGTPVDSFETLEEALAEANVIWEANLKTELLRICMSKWRDNAAKL